MRNIRAQKAERDCAAKTRKKKMECEWSLFTVLKSVSERKRFFQVSERRSLCFPLISQVSP
jgi:hypothetical protein